MRLCWNMKCYEQDLNADKADGFIGHPIESRLHLCFVTDKTKSWVCNNDWSLVWVAVPWWLLDSWPSANESGSFQTPEIFRLWVQKPPAAPNAICPQTQRRNHTPDQACVQICVYVHHGELFPSMWSEGEHVWPLHVWLQPLREEVGFYSAMAFPGGTRNGKEMQREKEEKEEERD